MIIDDNKDTVTCRICGEQCKRIYGKHLKFSHNNMTTKEYKILYPDAPIMALSDINNTKRNSGKHMKEEKYKKMFSEKIKGDKNPNHKSKTTDEVRKSRSPFSKSFLKYKGLENIEDHISSFAKTAIKDRISDTTLKYYLDRGYSVEVANQMLSDRQKTFSLEKCVEKYGEFDGYKRWVDRQEKWQRNLLENGNIKCGYSKVSQDLFFNILKNYDYDKTDMSKIYFATKNKEYFLSIKDKGFFVYDYVDLNSMKIIEYNGDLYHANPNYYKENDYTHPYYRENGPSALDMWNRDKMKIDIAIKNGFEVFVVWDSDYKRDKNRIIDECLNFLKIK